MALAQVSGACTVLGAGQPVSLTVAGVAEEKEEEEEEGGGGVSSGAMRQRLLQERRRDATTHGASSCQRMQEASKDRDRCAPTRSLTMLPTGFILKNRIQPAFLALYWVELGGCITELISSP